MTRYTAVSSSRLQICISMLALILMSMLVACTKESIDPNAWPVASGQVYPNTQFVDSNNVSFGLHDLKAKAVILEFIGMSCAGCQALAGAHETGSLHGVQPQSGIPTLDTLLGPYAQDDDVVVLQVLLYNPGLKQTGVSDAKLWAGHFNATKRNTFRVVVPTKDMRSKTAYDSIPGVQVLDASFRVRFDARGHHPRDNMFRDLQHAIRDVLRKPVESEYEIQAAYRSIPHRQTAYTVVQSSLSPGQSSALGDLFALTDVALVARTKTLQWVESGSRSGMSLSEYQQRMQEIYRTLEEQQKAHPQLESIYTELKSALQEQEMYFKQAANSNTAYVHNQHVRKASEHLKKAYSLLMGQYSGENSTNKQAFFDHLCALDFI